LLVGLLGALLVWGFQLDTAYDVAIVGTVPSGLPDFQMPTLGVQTLRDLFPLALTIALMGYMESISIAMSLASKRRQKVDPDQEFIALGVANFASALTGGYTVNGGLSRSVVNFMAGAQTGVASIVTAALILLTVLFLTPLFYFLPQAVLAAIIVVAVISLFDVKTFRHVWQTSRPDGVTLLVTFGAVLSLGIEVGIWVGAGVAIFLHLWQTSRPTIVQLGRLLGTEQYLDVSRYDVEVQPDVHIMQVNESLYFPNVQRVEEYILGVIATRHDVQAVVLVCRAVNTIDASAIHMMESLVQALHNAGVRLYLAEVKPNVLERLERSGCLTAIGEKRVFKSTFEAYLAAKVPPKAEFAG
jgi:SulP family sulfate permease